MPTWLTVGPADFWGSTSNLGVFSTGFNARMPVEWVPPQYGQFSINAGDPVALTRLPPELADAARVKAMEDDWLAELTALKIDTTNVQRFNLDAV